MLSPTLCGTTRSSRCALAPAGVATACGGPGCCASGVDLQSGDGISGAISATPPGSLGSSTLGNELAGNLHAERTFPGPETPVD